MTAKSAREQQRDWEMSVRYVEEQSVTDPWVRGYAARLWGELKANGQDTLAARINEWRGATARSHSFDG